MQPRGWSALGIRRMSRIGIRPAASSRTSRPSLPAVQPEVDVEVNPSDAHSLGDPPRLGLVGCALLRLEMLQPRPVRDCGSRCPMESSTYEAIERNFEPGFEAIQRVRGGDVPVVESIAHEQVERLPRHAPRAPAHWEDVKQLLCPLVELADVRALATPGDPRERKRPEVVMAGCLNAGTLAADSGRPNGGDRNLALNSASELPGAAHRFADVPCPAALARFRARSFSRIWSSVRSWGQP